MEQNVICFYEKINSIPNMNIPNPEAGFFPLESSPLLGIDQSNWKSAMKKVGKEHLLPLELEQNKMDLLLKNAADYNVKILGLNFSNTEDLDLETDLKNAANNNNPREIDLIRLYLNDNLAEIETINFIHNKTHIQ